MSAFRDSFFNVADNMNWDESSQFDVLCNVIEQLINNKKVSAEDVNEALRSIQMAERHLDDGLKLPDESMDGDFDFALASGGFGSNEDCRNCDEEDFDEIY